MNITNTIRAELEDAGNVYSLMINQGGAHNLDYAGYAGQLTIEKLQEMLNNPELSIDQLESLMRKVSRKHNVEDGPEKRWSHVMARFITRHANANTDIVG